jgi:hypothetical protein
MSDTKALEEVIKSYSNWAEIQEEIETGIQATTELTELTSSLQICNALLNMASYDSSSLRIELDKARKVIKSALIDLETPEEVDEFVASAFRKLAAYVAPNTEAHKEMK